MRTKLIKSSYLELYKVKQPITISKHLGKVKPVDTDRFSFGYSISAAAVHSSMIEGNPIDFDSYLKFSESGMNTKSKSYKEIQDLIKAYDYATKHDLTYSNFLKAHKFLSETNISEQKYKGKLRDKDVFVYASGKKIYTGTGIDRLEGEMNTFFEDIHILLERNLSLTETFYFASMIHLVFVQIHPFADGNGRSARLLEKWFLSEKIGERAWFIKSEILYQKRIKSYYKNVNIGNNYLKINYDLCLPFLFMLPMALRIK